MPIHDGHRQRLKERFRKEGLDGFTEVQALELLLFYALPRQDTNPIAHRLLERFGSFSNVLDASVERLTEVEGIGEHAALFLQAVQALSRYYDLSKIRQEHCLQTIADCGRYLIPYFKNRRNETVFLLSLDAKLKVLECREVGEGSINYASVPVRRVVEMALEAGATSVILAHNHPSGIAVPSMDDVQTTKRVARALSAVEIVLVDHIVVADDDYVSLVQTGYRFDD
jgi:DNA repair protein RadC